MTRTAKLEPQINLSQCWNTLTKKGFPKQNESPTDINNCERSLHGVRELWFNQIDYCYGFVVVCSCLCCDFSPFGPIAHFFGPSDKRLSPGSVVGWPKFAPSAEWETFVNRIARIASPETSTAEFSILIFSSVAGLIAFHPFALRSGMGWMGSNGLINLLRSLPDSETGFETFRDREKRVRMKQWSNWSQPFNNVTFTDDGFSSLARLICDCCKTNGTSLQRDAEAFTWHLLKAPGRPADRTRDLCTGSSELVY